MIIFISYFIAQPLIQLLVEQYLFRDELKNYGKYNKNFTLLSSKWQWPFFWVSDTCSHFLLFKNYVKIKGFFCGTCYELKSCYLISSFVVDEAIN